MMEKFIILLLIFLLPWRGLSQDERYFRQIFTGELTKETEKDSEKKYSYLFHTAYYAMDLNGDGKSEYLVFVKKDSEDWLEIFDEEKGVKSKIFSYRFETKGYNSEVFKVELKKISESGSVLIVHFFEGLSQYTEMQSTSRIYALTVDNKNLKMLSMFKGPSVFEEHKSLKGHYHLRNYQVYLEDLNHDNWKELVVKFHNTSQVYIYDGAGKWKTFAN